MRLPPGRARLVTRPEPIGSETLTNTIGIVRLSRCKCRGYRRRICKEHIGLQMDQLFGERLILIRIVGRKAIFNVDIAVLRPSEPFEPCRNAASRAFISVYPPHPIGLLAAQPGATPPPRREA